MDVCLPKNDHRDFIIITLLTLVYLCLTLFNLGSRNVPQTGWKPAQAGDSFLLDLGGLRSLSRICFYEGDGVGRYRVEYRGVDGDYYPLGIIEKRDFYKWNSLKVTAQTDRIRVTTEAPGGTLLELGFYERDKQETLTQEALIDPVIVERSVHPTAEGRVEQLFDEAETLTDDPTFLTGTYFDEIYYARTAYEHLRRVEPYETTHPPLGKLLIALGIMIFGKKLFGGRFFPFCAAALLTFDFMHFTQTRIATIDVYAVFFILLMYYYFYDYAAGVRSSVNSLHAGSRGRGVESVRSLFKSGVCFGLGSATKWITLYGAAGLAFLFLWMMGGRIFAYLRAHRRVRQKAQDKLISLESQGVWEFLRRDLGYLVFCGVLSFLLLPAVIYLLSYWPFMMVPGPGHGLRAVFTYQRHMFNYHRSLVATHPFASSWWEWPLIIRPIWFYGHSNYALDTTSSIASLGNPAIWWVGMLLVIPAAVFSLKKRDKGMAVIFATLLSLYLPWALVSRLTFIYHFFSCVPFLIFALVYTVKILADQYPDYSAYVRGVFCLYLGLVIGLFIRFYPVLSGLEISRAYVDKLRWFKHWIF
ncbi:MAG TPA: phospholipid carrier-dependent glycosyltransferase [Firmicutes bacterium]|nr:phospholipid carrier-dependent glycosyltransferase [Bacillota bacterium]